MDNDKNQKSKYSKRRLRWNCELHHRFIDAVNQLGGPNKATPKGLMRIMVIPELTLYHIKSHLQKYRLGKSERFVGNKQYVSSAAKTQETRSQKDFGDQPNKGLQIMEAIEKQLEVQKKLHEQIEVQRQLQVRVEAQRKYLQSVLMKAQETLSGYTSSNLGIDLARSELYGVASMANRSCLTSSFSGLTQADEEAEEEEVFLGSKKPENRGIRQARSSVDSSLSSPESSEAKTDCDSRSVMKRSIELHWNDVVSMERPTVKRPFGGHDGEDLQLTLNRFKDKETCSNM